MSRWTQRSRAAALERLAGLAERGVPWGTGFEALAEEHGAARFVAARRALAEGQGPAAVLELARLVSADERALLERRAGELSALLRELASHARDEATVHEALRSALAYPCARLVMLCAAAGVIWFVVFGSLSAGNPIRGSNLAKLSLLVFGGTLVWTLPVVACWLGWRLAKLRGLIEWFLRVLPMLGKVVRLHTAACFWRTLGLGLRLEQPLPVALRAVRDSFAPGSLSRREAESLVPAADEGRDLPGVISYLHNPNLREEHILRVAQQRGSLADDVLALAELRREQLLDAARTEGAALILLADGGLMLATGAMMVLLLLGMKSGLSPLSGLFYY